MAVVGTLTMKIVAIIQARMSSQRLPGKSLMDIQGQALLGHVIDRARASATVDEVMLATTVEPVDAALEDYARLKGVGTYRGSVQDVLDRFYQAALVAKADVVVRVTADDPFKDPDVVDRVVRRLLDDHKLDYASNTITPTYPEGLDIECFRFAALARAWGEASQPSEREHVTPYIWKHPDLFRVENVTHAEDLSTMRWTIDYDRDLAFAREVYKRLYHGQVFRMHEILQLLREEPALAAINTGFERNAGYLASIKQETPPKNL